ncbi:hypothetical protein Tsubulata_044735, partial [Turnera subulata]
AGHFTIFIRLLRATQEENHLFSALNDSSSGITIFAPIDSAFSGLKSGTLNILSDAQKAELVKFHVVPTFLSTSQFQTVSNPLGTWAGTGNRLPLNVTSYPNSVNITSGLTNTSISGTVYTDGQLAIYRIEKVLLPVDIFKSDAPAPAPVAPAPEKPKKKAPAVESPDVPVDTSGAVSSMQNGVVLFGAVVVMLQHFLCNARQQSIFSFSLLLFFHFTLAQSPAAAPQAPIVAAPPQAPPAPVVQPPAAPPTQVAPVPRRGPTNVTKILEKAGHFSIFIRLLKSTQEENHLFSALNDSSSGITIFAPTDSAFSGLKSGTLNTLSDGDKSELVKFHVVPTFLSTSQFQTVTNPLGTWAGTGSRLPLNVTSYPNSVNITTGLTNTSISGTVYTDSQLAIYRVEKVLLPADIFVSKAPAPAPLAPAPEKPKKKAPEVESPVVPVDTSGTVAPVPRRGPTNVTKILEKAGHFSIFIRLLKSTQEENHLFSALNDSSTGITIFAPTDSAFSGLKSGTLNTLSDGDKSELVKFHIVPTFLSTSQFQTVSNPLGTWAGTGSRLPLNVTSYPNSVNITTGLTNTSISGTVYTDSQLAIYRIEKVLLPVDIFSSRALAPAPMAPAPEKPKKETPAAESPVVPVDVSSAICFMDNRGAPAASPAQPPPAPAAQAPPTDPSQAPAALVQPSSGPLDVVNILTKAGRFTVFTRLLQATGQAADINKLLNTTNGGFTVFAPTDGAFSSLKPGFLNSLSDDDKAELAKFHVIPTFISTSSFQTVSNPVPTQAGTGKRTSFNVTTSGNFVNITTGLTNTSISGTVYSDNQLAIYQVDKVLFPLDIFTPKPPAPAPALAVEKPKNKTLGAAESPTVPTDTSAAENFAVPKSMAILALSLVSLSVLFLLSNCTKSSGQAPAASPAQSPPAPPAKAPPADSSQAPAAQVQPSSGPLDVVKILTKAGHFTVFNRLFQATGEDVELNKELNNTNNGVTIFAPTDGAFSGLKAGFLNSLSDADKTKLAKFHVIPTFISTSSFQTVSNPVTTQAGTSKRTSLNVTTSGNFVNITTGLTNTSISGTVYSDNRLGIYQVDKVLFPLDLFTPKPPAPAPALAVEKPKNKTPDAAAESPTVPTDTSSAVNFAGYKGLLFLAVAMAAAMF